MQIIHDPRKPIMESRVNEQEEMRKLLEKARLIDMLSLPLSETYKDILRRNHSEEWIQGLEEAIKQHKSNS